MNPKTQESSEPRYGWVTVAIAFVSMGVQFGAMVSISVFLIPLVVEFGWPRGDTSFAYAAGMISAGLGGIVMGWMTDRFSTRPVFLFGAVMLGLSLLLLSNLRTLWQFYLFYCILGGLGFAGMNVPIITNVGQWFNRNKGLALGITTAGATLGQAWVPYFTSYVMTFWGWRAAYTILAILFWAMMVPLGLLIRTPPSLGKGRSTSPPGNPSVADSVFPITPAKAVMWLSTAVIFCCICMATPIVHVVALVSDGGIDPQSAAGVLSLIMIAGLFGRVIVGKIADHIGGLRAYLVASAAQTALVFWFTQLHSMAAFNILGVLFGLGYSGVMTCIFICVREMTPPQRAGLSLGVITLFASIGMGLGGYQGGFFFDLTGDYTFSFANAALAGVVNLLILGTLLLLVKRNQAALTGSA